MATVTRRWIGFAELREVMRQMPEEFAGEAANIIEGRANAAALEIKSGYPSRTGKLRKGVQVEHSRSRFGARSVVSNTHPQALAFEVGTQARHTDIGANRGSMPAGNVFYPPARRQKKRMYQELKDMLVRKGLMITDG